MPTRTLLTFATLPVVLAGAMLSAVAQTAPQPDQPAAAQDRVAIEAAFAKADANGDGKLSRDELSQVPAVGARFESLDKDKDGSLSLSEYSVAYTTTK